ncbi:MAG: ribonuclease E/G [Sphingomonadales bacterium]|nr:ribonuclease E/G [Sphingomonadales bacterium]MBD3772262.1 ribonuclease E/G [Paracoccaceae bacterium]
MATRMLIDARHPEETRVAVLKGNRIEEFDFESAEHKQIKGNIYLAKVTRVEPSLQAAFVDFGGNRHGFLAFSEIHPDYYQIPKEDREALLAEEAAAAEEEAALRAAEDVDDFGESALDRIGGEDDNGDDNGSAGGVTEIDTSEKDDVATIEEGRLEDGDDEDDGADGDEDDTSEAGDEDDDDRSEDDGGEDDRSRGGRGRRGRRQGKGSSARAKEADALRAKRLNLRRRYKIQDVIQRRQVLLVQVVKEERGNKGAALTTYLSLAGRYCVLMPNSSHGGGISRKISSAADRKRLKSIVSEMSLPKSMGLIVRTAGLQRTKTEIKRDFDYLARLWDEIRENTLKSTAPALIHSDSDLIKRAIRDIYNREIEEVIVEGEDGYRSAREFMKLLMPSHARRVKAYSDPMPLFQRYGAEDQLRAMYDPVVQLKSGGYLVINPTEALVSIDINSGRSTKEHGIEQTAVATNVEAAKEIARQLRLRDMAGLVVIDFIDMEYSSNIRKVEKAMKDALKHDRARIQVGRISGFGLMEMSRQRLRTGVLEATTRECPHCDGTGLVRTASSAGLSALRLIEDEAAKGKGTIITLSASTEASIYLLNAKRGDLQEIEDRYGVHVQVIPEGEDEGAKMSVSSSGPRPTQAPRFDPIVDEEEEGEDLIDEIEDEEDEDDAPRGDADDDRGNRNKKRRRRRGGRGRKRRDEQGTDGDAEDSETDDRDLDDEDSADDDSSPAEADDAGDRPKKRRRRGGRRRRGRKGEEGETTSSEGEEALDEVSEQLADDIAVVAEPAEAVEAEAPAEEAPKPKRSRRKKATEPAAEEAGAQEAPTEEAATEEAAEEKPKPKRTRRKKVEEPAADEQPAAEAPASEEAPAAEDKPKPKRTRRKKAEEAPVVEDAEPIAAPAPAEPVAEPAEAPAAEAEAPAEDGAPRRGWWQRTFGE